MNRKENADHWLNNIVTQSGGKINRKGLQDAIKNKDFSSLIAALSPEDRKALTAAMSDQARLRELLRSDQAKSMMKKIRGEEKNG